MRTTTKTLILFILLLCAPSLWARTNTLYKKYKKAQDVEHIAAGNLILKIVGLTDKDARVIFNTLNVRGIKALRLADTQDCIRLAEFRQDVNTFNANGYEEVYASSKKDEELRIMTLIKGDKIREVMITSIVPWKREANLIVLSCNVKVEKVASILVGGPEFKRLVKKLK